MARPTELEESGLLTRLGNSQEDEHEGDDKHNAHDGESNNIYPDVRNDLSDACGCR
jgi:hypothetical protein